MKLLLTDIDGVILNWSDHFRKYLQQYYPDVDLWDPTVFAQQDITADIIKHYNYLLNTNGGIIIVIYSLTHSGYGGEN